MIAAWKVPPEPARESLSVWTHSGQWTESVSELTVQEILLLSGVRNLDQTEQKQAKPCKWKASALGLAGSRRSNDVLGIHLSSMMLGNLSPPASIASLSQADSARSSFGASSPAAPAAGFFIDLS